MHLETAQPFAAAQAGSLPNVTNVCVIGAGTMGTGIAAHLANLGFCVSLVDVTRERAEESIDRARSGHRPAFMTAAAALAVEPVSLADLESVVEKSQWICEAIVERMDAKRDVLARIDDAAPIDALLTTNTSGLPINQLAEGRSPEFRRRFHGAHFFNPPRYLRLLELIGTEDTDPNEIERARWFFESHVARRVVPAKDTPGFIANRFGMWALFNAIHVAEQLHLTVGQADLFSGEFIGRPRSGTFGLADVIGIDVMLDIARGLKERCPGDEFSAMLEPPASLQALWTREWLGEKTGHGYYRRQNKDSVTLDLTTMVYGAPAPAESTTVKILSAAPLGERLVHALDAKDEAGEFIRNHLLPTLRYADAIKEEISYSVRDFDRVMRWGWGWERGPFELIDAIGADRVGIKAKRFYDGPLFRAFDGRMVAQPAEPEFIDFEALPVIDQHPTFNVRDLGDGVIAVAIATKMGVITPQLVKELSAFLDAQPTASIVLTSEAKAFSAGYDITVFERAIGNNTVDEIEPELAALQALGEKLNAVRAVAAVYGHCLGAGFELALSCSTIVAAAESKIGFPEARIGLLPAGRGTVLMRIAHDRAAGKLADVAALLAEGRVSTSAPDAKQLGFLRTDDVIEFLPDRLLWRAKQAAKNVKPAGVPKWGEITGPLTGMLDRVLAERRAQGILTDYDVQIGERIKGVFVRSATYADALAKERDEFIDLLGRPFTQLRLKHMRETGKPLRN
ncbi:MAG: 3-hydroxyacyl-CoA dehydrogenase NAD-binding domain-containing protein [Fimbriimonadaceae bacterium]